jgi:hypothetical protein
VRAVYPEERKLSVLSLRQTFLLTADRLIADA